MNPLRYAAVVVAVQFAGLLPTAPASADLGGACSLSFPVTIDAQGQIEQPAPGTARCAGRLGHGSVEPLPAVAYLSGAVGQGANPCTPALIGGRFAMLGKPLISFDPHPSLPFYGVWAADTPAPTSTVNGKGSADGLGTSFAGVARFVAGEAGCSSGDAVRGTIELDLVVDTGTEHMPAPSSPYPDPEPAAATVPAAPSASETQPPRAARKKHRSCKSRKTRAARRRCRRAQHRAHAHHRAG